MSELYTDIRKYGNKILHRGYKNGVRIHEEVAFKPSAFIPTTEKGTEWKTLYGIPVIKKDFNSIKDCENFYREYDGLSNLEIHGMRKYPVQFSHDRYPNKIDIDRSVIKSGFIDIEVHDDFIEGFPYPHKAEFSVVTISIVTSTNKIWVASLKPDDKNFNIENSLSSEGIIYPIEYHQFNKNQEKELLLKFLEFLRTEDFDILSGWNSDGFDLPYLYNRISKMLGESNANKLSPWGNCYIREYEKFNQINSELSIHGIQSLDYLKVFQKFGLIVFGPQENLKLNTIAKTVLGAEKLDYSEYSNLSALYKENPKLHTEYCIQDALLVKRLEDKLRYFNIIYSMAYKGKVNYEETLGVTAFWDSYIYGELLKDNICVPPLKYSSSDEQYEGAYVKEVIPGLYEWMLGIDIAALYPTTIYQFNISPETMGEYVPGVSVESLLAGEFPEVPEGFNLTANGWTYNSTKLGIIPRLIIEGLNERDLLKVQLNEYKAKKEQSNSENFKNIILDLEADQSSVKLRLNSLYGALGTGSFRYFDIRLAESITKTGQVINRSSENAINSYLQKIIGDTKDRIIAMDTDSVAGDSLVYCNGNKIKIEDLYNKFSEYVYFDDFNKNYVKPTADVFTLSFNKNTKSIESKPINYIMKHRVTKKMYNIICNGNNVIVTEDHSIEVLRDGNIISVRPSELDVKKDKIISIDTRQSVSIGMIKCQENIVSKTG
jgi:DNA polymerase elongation subunit (family B)